jgi:Phosphate transport (Pho88)
MGLSDQVSSLLFVLLLVQATKHLDMTDPAILFYFRLAYITSQVLLLALAALTLYRIRQKNEINNSVRVPEPQTPSNPWQPSAETTSAPKMITMSVRAYDVGKVREFISQTVFSFFFLLFLHLKFEFVHPLLLQSILPLKNALFMPIFQIHLFGRPPIGDLERPFKAPKSPFADLFAQGGDSPSAEDVSSSATSSTLDSAKLPSKIKDQ